MVVGPITFLSVFFILSLSIQVQLLTYPLSNQSKYEQLETGFLCMPCVCETRVCGEISYCGKEGQIGGPQG